MIKVFQMAKSHDSFSYGMGDFDPVKNIDKYVHVADLNVNTLDEAFEVGNIGPEEKYTRYSRMHSVSVGDILEMDGIKYVVAIFGFDRLEVA